MRALRDKRAPRVDMNMHEHILEIYVVHNHAKLSEVADLMAKYSGCELILDLIICDSYNIEPAMPPELCVFGAADGTTSVP